MGEDDVGVWRLWDAIKGEPPYDPRCEQVETAVKAVWLLYRWAKWDWLALMGIPRAEFEPLFESFDVLMLPPRSVNDLEAPRLNDRDAANLVRYARGVRPGSGIRLLSAAYWMIGKYRQRKKTYKGLRVR